MEGKSLHISAHAYCLHPERKHMGNDDKHKRGQSECGNHTQKNLPAGRAFLPVFLSGQLCGTIQCPDSVDQRFNQQREPAQ